MVRYLNRNNEWIVIVVIERIENASARGPVLGSRGR